MELNVDELRAEALALANQINERLGRFEAYPGLDIRATGEARISITVEALRELTTSS